MTSVGVESKEHLIVLINKTKTSIKFKTDRKIWLHAYTLRMLNFQRSSWPNFLRSKHIGCFTQFIH